MASSAGLCAFAVPFNQPLSQPSPPFVVTPPFAHIDSTRSLLIIL